MATALTACGEKAETTKENEKPVVKIGATLPLSGNMAYLGNVLKKGALLAIEDINKRNNNTFMYHLIIEDDQMMPQKAALNAQKLINVDKVSMLITALASNALAVNSIAENNKTIAFHHSHLPIASKGYYNFQNLVLDYQLTEMLIKFIQNKKYEKVALFFQNTAAGEEVSSLLKNKLGKDIIINDFFIQSNSSNLSTIGYKLKKFNPDLTIVYGFSPLIEQIGKEILLQKIEGDKIGVDLTNASNKIEYFENYYSINSQKGNNEFVKNLGSHLTYQAPYVYDSINFFIRAVENIKNNDSSLVVNEILKISEFEGVNGKTMVNKEGQFDSKPKIYRVIKGKPVVVEE